MLEEFIPKKFTAAHKHVIKQANAIIEEYQKTGYALTLRQLYYQFVARDLTENNKQSYKRLGNIVDSARKAGLIDWDAIQDRTRNIRRIGVWSKPETALEAIQEQFKLDPWNEQSVLRRIEIWVEKDAAIGVVEPICNRFRLPYFSCRGYGSSSELYEAGKRLAAFRKAGYETLVLHLGDHDPSGVQMTEDNQNRLDLFARQGIELRRIALTMKQIEEHRPPPNFAKQTDSRTKWYIDKFGTDDAWELDALAPQIINDLIESHVQPLINQEEWDATMAREAEHKATLAEIISDWSRTKAAPDMLRLIQQHAALVVEAEPVTDDGFYAHNDSSSLAHVITDSDQLLAEHNLGYGND